MLRLLAYTSNQLIRERVFLMTSHTRNMAATDFIFFAVVWQ